MEPLLQENPDRYVVFPIIHHDLWNLYKQHQSTYWTREEIDFSHDLYDWNTKLNDSERFFLKHILAFFAASDGLVSENLVSSFCQEVQYPEARVFYGFQNMIENIHNETYSVMIDTYIQNSQERMDLFCALETFPAVQKKAFWAKKWMKCEKSEFSFSQRLVAFAIIEGIFFSASFCAIFWLARRNLMPGLCKSNEFIARDEGLHQLFACVLYKNHIVSKLTQTQVHDMFREAVEVEYEFITHALPCRLLNMNAEHMYQYIQYVADRLLEQLGYSALYRVQNPFDFMKRNDLMGKTNFFECRVSEYQKVGIAETDFSTDSSF